MSFEFEKLNVYQKAVDFADRIYKITRAFPKTEQFGITSQFRRAALSISLNIAEGSGRPSGKDRVHFFHIARTSVFECIPILEIVKRHKYISPDTASDLYNSCISLSKMLMALIKSHS